jgi:hypothetical protein
MDPVKSCAEITRGFRHLGQRHQLRGSKQDEGQPRNRETSQIAEEANHGQAPVNDGAYSRKGARS